MNRPNENQTKKGNKRKRSRKCGKTSEKVLLDSNASCNSKSWIPKTSSLSPSVSESESLKKCKIPKFVPSVRSTSSKPQTIVLSDDESFNDSCMETDGSLCDYSYLYGKAAPKFDPKEFASDDSSSSSSNEAPPVEKAMYYDTPLGKLVVMLQGQTVHFQGLFTLSVLHGRVEILGYRVDVGKKLKVYSPRGGSSMCIKNVAQCDETNTNILREGLGIAIKIEKNQSVFLCELLKDHNVSFIERHISQQIMPQNADGKARVCFEPKGNLTKINPEWDEIIRHTGPGSRLMVSGGKGVGKSTFLRYAINRLLSNHVEVRVVDLDPGQSEFTVPGCISIVTVKEPLLGPNYTHLTKSSCSILSNIDVGQDPKKYLQSVEHLCKNLTDSCTTLINCMGWTHGIGSNIAASVISLVSPTDIVEISSNHSKHNFKTNLGDPLTVLKQARLFLGSDLGFPNFNFVRIQSMGDEKEGGWVATPRLLREMCILSYFGQMLTNKSFFNTKVTLIEINLAEIPVIDADGQDVPLAAITANLVELCSFRERDILQCHGWAIVRGVDVASNIAVIITPEKPEVLDKVDRLVYNRITLPPAAYMTDENIGHIPYVMKGVLSGLGEISKRSHIPNK